MQGQHPHARSGAGLLLELEHQARHALGLLQVPAVPGVLQPLQPARAALGRDS